MSIPWNPNVLVRAAVREYHRLGGRGWALTNIYFTQIWRLLVHPHSCDLVKDTIPGFQTTIFSLYLLWVEREGWVSSSSYKAANPIMKAPLSWCSYLPNASLPNTITVILGLQYVNWQTGETQTFSP